MFELLVVLVALFLVASIPVQVSMGMRAGRAPSPRTLCLVVALYVWAGLTFFIFAPGGFYLSLVAGPVALLPFALVSTSGFILAVRLVIACSYLLRGVDAQERIARIVRYSHAHHLAVAVVFVVASGVMAVYGGVDDALALAVFVSVASGIGGLLGAALGYVGLSDRAPSRYSLSDAEEAA